MRRQARGAATAALVLCAWMNLVACQRESAPPTQPSDAAPSNTAAPAADRQAAQIPPSAADGYSVPAPAAADAPTAPPFAPTVEFSVPRTVNAGKAGDIVLTIAKVTTEPLSSESVRLVFSVRMLNNQRQAADFSDQNFRLVTKDSVIAANGGLAETIGAGTESGLQQVQFLVPINAVPRALKIDFGGESTELPLTFK